MLDHHVVEIVVCDTGQEGSRMIYLMINIPENVNLVVTQIDIRDQGQGIFNPHSRYNPHVVGRRRNRRETPRRNTIYIAIRTLRMG
jgi:hypothetical protein